MCGGILRLQEQRKKAAKNPDVKSDIPESKFKTPYINSKWITPILFIVTAIAFFQYYPGGVSNFFSVEGEEGWGAIRVKIPYILFGITFLITAILSFIRNYSLIPVLGFLSCSYLLSESGTSNWERFTIWLVIGLVIYFLYGARNSRLKKLNKQFIAIKKVPACQGIGQSLCLCP